MAEEIRIFIYVDTGALYRSIGLHMLKKNIFPGDEQAVPRELEHVDIALEFKDGEQRVILCGEDVSDLIRTSEVSKASSQVSAIPAVREFLLELQKNMAKTHNVIMDGRDIGTVVLPDAQVKVFLTASAEERAKRRHKEMLEKGNEADLSAILEEIKERDERDANREIAPLVPAKDAVFVDTNRNDHAGSHRHIKRTHCGWGGVIAAFSVRIGINIANVPYKRNKNESF